MADLDADGRADALVYARTQGRWWVFLRATWASR